MQKVDTDCFQHRNTDLGTLIWAFQNLIFSKTEKTVKHNSSFLIKSAMQSEHNNQKIENVNVMDSLFGLPNHNFGTSLCYNLVG